MRRCLCGAVSSSAAAFPSCLSLCLWRVAACARSLFVSVSAASTSIRKIITLDMIEYTAEYILYQREVPVASCVATASGRKANPFQCPASQSARCPPNVLRHVSQLLLLLHLLDIVFYGPSGQFPFLHLYAAR